MISPHLMFFTERLAGFSTNYFHLQAQKDTATSSDVIVFDIPSNALVSLKSFKVFCNAATEGADPTGTNKAGARLPPIMDLIERIEISAGGITLSQGSTFSNVFLEAMKALTGHSECATLGHPEYVRQKSYVTDQMIQADGSTIGTFDVGAHEAYSVPSGDSLFALEEWHHTFLGTAQPDILDTSLLPELRIRLYMASNNVLSASANVDSIANFTLKSVDAASAAKAKYTLSNIHATIECVALADSTYDSMVASQMSAAGYLEIPYKSIEHFEDSHSGTSRFTVSSQSLDRVWVCWRASDYNTVGAPIAISGHAGAPYVYDEKGTKLGCHDMLTEKYKGKYFNFVAPKGSSNTAGGKGGWKMQLSLNGAYMPQFPAAPAELYGISKNSLKDKGGDISLDQYLKNYCVQCFRLNMPGSEKERVISGLDTRSVNLQGIVRTEGATSGFICTIFTESTSCLRVGAGRTLDVLP